MDESEEPDESKEVIIEEIDESKYTFYCMTTQSIAMKLLSEAIKDFTEEVNIVLDENEIVIEMFHPSKSCLGRITLMRKRFEYYYCPYEFYIGVELKALYSILKSISDAGSLSLYIYKDNTSKLYIKYCNKSVEIVSSLSLLAIPFLEMNNDDIPYTHVIKMPVKEFQRNIKDLSSISEQIKIGIEDGKFIMKTVSSPLSNTNTKITFTSTYDIAITEIDPNKFDVPEGYEDMLQMDTYLGKLIANITKSGNISTTVDILLCKQPLVLIYGIGTLGSIKYIICPCITSDD